MVKLKNSPHKIIIVIVIIALLVMGITLFIIPSAVFPDPGMGFQVLRSMQMGGGFNNIVSPDQSDISQTYTEFLTWWSPGQYLVPYFFKRIAGINLGHAVAITVVLSQFFGLAGFYCFFKKIGFTPFIAAISLVFIICQEAFVVPYVYYNGGEVLLFAFEGWFLYGCTAITKPGIKQVLFVLLAGWTGFFLKSSFIWMYAAGIACLWIRLSAGQAGIWRWIRNGLWIAIPAIVSLLVIYLVYISRGQSPATVAKGFKLSIETFSFPLASPVLSAFSVDDIFHGLIFHTGKPLVDAGWSIIIIVVLMLLSLLLILAILKYISNNTYRLFVVVFYAVSFAFFSVVYLKQLNISYEARHFRIIGLLIVPGLIYLVSKIRKRYQWAFGIMFIGLAYISFFYLAKGYTVNSLNARGVTGIAQPNIDQQSLNQIMRLDNENKNATFVFIGNDTGLEIVHNRIISLQPIGDDLKIDMDDYTYDGFAGPLYIVLPESYNGPKEKMIMKSFQGYAGFTLSMLSNNYVLYSANMKR